MTDSPTPRTNVTQIARIQNIDAIPLGTAINRFIAEVGEILERRLGDSYEVFPVEALREEVIKAHLDLAIRSAIETAAFGMPEQAMVKPGAMARFSELNFPNNVADLKERFQRNGGQALMDELDSRLSDHDASPIDARPEVIQETKIWALLVYSDIVREIVDTVEQILSPSDSLESTPTVTP